VTRAKLPATVVLLGLTSFLTDVSSEMIFPLLPLFLSETLGAGAAFLGLVEGAADTVASGLKLAAGSVADRLPRRKPLVLAGYGLAGCMRPLMAAAVAPWHVLVIRLSDRVGKGLRSAPRDALIADTVDPNHAARAFGFHRAMDHAGAVIGPLVATLLLAGGLGLRSVFALAAVPAVLAFVAVLAIRETPAARRVASSPTDPAGASALPGSLRAYLGILFVFSLGNSSDAFLLLRARDLGLSAAAVPALWALLHIVKSTSAYAGGLVADRWQRTTVIMAGWAVYAAVYLGLGVASAAWQVWLLFAVYGVYYGLTEPAERALIHDVAPAAARGRAFGYYHFIIGLTALPAGLLTGWLWSSFGPRVALGVGAGLAGIASAALLIWNAAARRTPR
jgi:MFS family permease